MLDRAVGETKFVEVKPIANTLDYILQENEWNKT